MSTKKEVWFCGYCGDNFPDQKSSDAHERDCLGNHINEGCGSCCFETTYIPADWPDKCRLGLLKPAKKCPSWRPRYGDDEQ